MGSNACGVFGTKVNNAIRDAISSKVRTVQGQEAINSIKSLYTVIVNTGDNVGKLNTVGQRALDWKQVVAGGFGIVDDNRFNELLKVLTGRPIRDEQGNIQIVNRFESINDLATLGDDIHSQLMLKGIQSRVEGVLRDIIKVHSDPESLYDGLNDKEFADRFRGLIWAKKTGSFIDKALSMTWIPGISQSILGNRAIVFRSHNVIDRMRGLKVQPFKDSEARIGDLMNNARSIVSRSGAVRDGLSLKDAGILLKYYDGQFIEGLDAVSRDKFIQNKIKEYIENEENGVTIKGDQVDYIVKIKQGLDSTVSELRVLNYGEDYKATGEKEFFDNYYKNWENYEKSYMYNMIKTGAEYVKMIDVYDTFSTKQYGNGIKIDPKGMEAEMLSRFSLYHFKDYKKANDFLGRMGILSEGQEMDSLYIRSDYMHIHELDQNNTLPSTIKITKNKDMSAAAIQEREDLSNNPTSNMLDNMIKNIEQLRIMSTRAFDKSFAKVIYNVLDNDKQWGENNAYEADDLRRFAKRLNEQKTIEMSGITMAIKQFTYAILALGTTGILQYSGLKNVLNGWIGMGSAMDMNDLLDKQFGQFSIKKAKNSDDVNVVEIAKQIERQVMPSSGKKAEYIIKDTISDDNTLKILNKTSKAVMKYAESRLEYGVMAPIKAFTDAYFPTGGVSSKVNDMSDYMRESLFTMHGSEKHLRKWRQNEALHSVLLDYKLDMEFVEKYKNSSDMNKKKQAETLNKLWSKGKINDTIKESLSFIDYDLYNKDAEYLGDFNPDTKPFWSHMLEDADNIPKVMLGFAITGLMTFRHPVNYALNQTMQNVAKRAGRREAVNIPMMQSMLLMFDIANDSSDTVRERFGWMGSPLLGVLNQGIDVGLPIKGATALISAGLNLPMSKRSYYEISKDFARWTGGVAMGRSLESLAEDFYREEPLFTVMKARFNSLKDFPNLITAKSYAQYKRASEGSRQAMNIPVPFFDSITSSSHDELKVITDTYRTISATYHSLTNRKGENFVREIPSGIKSIFDNMTGLNSFALYQARFNDVLVNKTNDEMYKTHVLDQKMQTIDSETLEYLEKEE